MKPSSTENNRDPANLLNRDEPAILNFLFFYNPLPIWGFSYCFRSVFQIKYMKPLGVLFFYLLNLATLVLAHSFSQGSPRLLIPWPRSGDLRTHHLTTGQESANAVLECPSWQINGLVFL